MAGIEAFFEPQDDDEVVEIGGEATDENEADDTAGAAETTEEVEAATGETEGSATGDTDSESDEEAAEADGEGESEETEGEEEVVESSEDDDDKVVISSLRQMLREQAREIEALKSQSQGLTKTLVDTGTIEEGDIPAVEESGGISDERLQSLSLLAETMKVNPLYSDFEDVCSQDNFNSLVDTLAQLAQQQDGGTLTEQVQNVTDFIWAQPNPYKFVYDLVKENHPKYNSSAEQDDTATTETKPSKKTTKAPGSVATVAGGGGSSNDGWTAAKIDAMDEQDLHTVPQAVYEKYMRNELN